MMRHEEAGEASRAPKLSSSAMSRIGSTDTHGEKEEPVVVGCTSESDLSATKEAFRLALQRHFADLVSKGVGVNDAAALALKLASGSAESPLDLDAFLATAEEARRTREFSPVLDTIEGVFASADALSSSFLLNASLSPVVSKTRGSVAPSAMSLRPVGGNSIGAVPAAPPGFTLDSLSIDFPAVRRAYEAVLSLEDEGVVDALMRACGHVLDELLAAASVPAAGPALLRQVLILLENPLLMHEEHYGVLEKLARAVTSMPSAVQHALVLALQLYTSEQFANLVQVLQQFLTVQMYEQFQQSDGAENTSAIEATTRFLELLHMANEKAMLVPLLVFYNDAINSDDFDIKKDYQRWKQPDRYDFSFCKFPFVYDPASKSRILQLESTMSMSHEFEDAVLRSIFIGATCPYLVIKVRRDFIISDTMHQLQRRPDDLHKPLKVHFCGEDGLDEGGVQKEFFQLLIRNVFNPAYGMFSYDEDTRLFWFSACSSTMDLDTEREFELIGVVLGLAIYNGHILDFRFPMLIYKKLMGLSSSLEDLHEVNPSLYAGFKALLEYDGDVESAFGLVFQASQEYLGLVETVDLVKDGGMRPVTSTNRQDYIELYTRWYLETSIERQFRAFHRGFSRLCGGPVMSLFRPEELEQLICGSPELDFEALERRTVYDDGYTEDSPVIRMFWSVVHSLSEEEKKKLLFFSTGSDRVPIKGLANLPFIISKNGTGDERLPTAHTCFNHLLLPEYSTEEILRAKLLISISHATGFGLV